VRARQRRAHLQSRHARPGATVVAARSVRTATLTALALVAFAANSLLCRAALGSGSIDWTRFTAIRIASGAVFLALVVAAARRRRRFTGELRSGFALFVYAAAFSYAYVTLGAATGALLLFASVQATMVAAGLARGEALVPRQWLGFLLALAGLVALLKPGLAAPPLDGAASMVAAGVAWGVYSLRGRGAIDAIGATAGNFLRATPFALALLLLPGTDRTLEAEGVGYALASGALASGAGYCVWYAALPALRAASAAAAQLAVPVLTALGAVAWLGETVSWRLAGASAAILGGIALVVVRAQTPSVPDPATHARG
jgi:drug/metabolite transporter (DMT)-like permease